jgi:hypothetical protein
MKKKIKDDYGDWNDYQYEKSDKVREIHVFHE